MAPGMLFLIVFESQEHSKLAPIRCVTYLMSCIMRKPIAWICKNKGADQLHGNPTADLCLCFPYIDRTSPRHLKSEISSHYPSSVALQPGLCQTWLKTPKTGFLAMQLSLTFNLGKEPV